MVNQKNNSYWLNFNGLVRYLLVHLASNYFPLYIVNEFPKSGGSWLSQMLSDALDVPFPRNRLPMFKSSIMQGHYLSSWNMNNVVVIWRDGRDVLISLYYHSLFKNDRWNQLGVDMVRRDLCFDDYENIKENLPRFIEYVFRDKKHPKFSWSDFVNAWAGKKKVVHVKYEELRVDKACQLQRITNELGGKVLAFDEAKKIADKYSFEKMAGRKPGQERIRSFLRKGIIGDWNNHFTKEAKEIFAHYAGKELIKLDYERDFCWVND